MTAIPHMRFNRARPIQALSGRAIHISLVLVLIITQLVFVSGTAQAATTGSATVVAAAPVNTVDFADIAIDEVQELYNDATTVNEIQNILHDHNSGDFRVTFSGQETAVIAWNANAAAVTTALEDLSTNPDVTVTETRPEIGTWSSSTQETRTSP